MITIRTQVGHELSPASLSLVRSSYKLYLVLVYEDNMLAFLLKSFGLIFISPAYALLTCLYTGGSP
jgi:hypothetical protein